MTTAKNLECFFKEYENIVSNGLEYNYSEKEIYNAIYKKEFNNYLRKGIHPRLDELNLTINFVRKLRSGELSAKSEQKQWVWHSEPNSCAICQERDGRIYNEKPEPAHPHCNCEIVEIDEETAGKYEEDYKERLTSRDSVLKKLDEGTKTDSNGNPKNPNKSDGYCSRKVTDALQTVFGNKYNRPPKAKDSGESLEKVGFQKIPAGKNYEPRKGDIAVFQSYSAQEDPAGHIQMFDGEKWVSDYNQNTLGGIERSKETNLGDGFFANQSYKDENNFTIYRNPKWQEWE